MEKIPNHNEGVDEMRQTVADLTECFQNIIRLANFRDGQGWNMFPTIDVYDRGINKAVDELNGVISSESFGAAEVEKLKSSLITLIQSLDFQGGSDSGMNDVPDSVTEVADTLHQFGDLVFKLIEELKKTGTPEQVALFDVLNPMLQIVDEKEAFARRKAEALYRAQDTR